MAQTLTYEHIFYFVIRFGLLPHLHLRFHGHRVPQLLLLFLHSDIAILGYQND